MNTTTTNITIRLDDLSDEDRALIESLTPAEFEDARQAAIKAAEAKATEIRARHAASAVPR